MKIESPQDLIANWNEFSKLDSAQAASWVTKMIDKGVRDASTAYTSQLTEKETAVAKATEQAVKAQADAAKASAAAEVLAAELKDLKDKMKASEMEAKFHSRMAELDAEYDMSDEDKSCVASDIKDMHTDDASWQGYKNKFAVLAKEKSKAYKAKQKTLQDAKDAELEALKKQKEGGKSEAALAAEKDAEDKLKAEAAAKALDDAKLLEEQKNKATAGLSFDKESLIKTYKSAFAVEKVVKSAAPAK